MLLSMVLNNLMSLEVIEFGEEQEYKGNVIEYLMSLSRYDASKAAIIKEEYILHKDK